MDRLEAMAILLAVVDSGTLSAAARQLRLPLTTVSRKIADLETHLGTRLLARGNRRVALTDAGLSYVAACRRILEDVGEAERIAAGEYSAPRGSLLITAPIVFGRLHVLPVVTEFLAAYPDVDIRLRLADRLVNLGEEHIDLAVRIGDLPDSSLVAIRLGEITQVVCASPILPRLARHADGSARRCQPDLHCIRRVRPAPRLGLSLRQSRNSSQDPSSPDRQHRRSRD